MGPEKIAPLVAQELERSGKASVLVRLKDQADLSLADYVLDRAERGRIVFEQLRHTAISSQAPLIALLRERGASFRRFYISNMVLIEEANPELVREIARRADVAQVIGNPVVRGLKLAPPRSAGLLQVLREWLSRSLRPLAVEPNIVFTGASRVWQEFNARGAGIVVAGQDTGVQWDHPGLKRQYRGFAGGKVDHRFSWHDSIHQALPGQGGINKCGYELKAPCDDDRHGTHTMGTIVGDDGGQNTVGMAPDAQWIACRNMDKGLGTPATYIECFEFFLAPYPQGADPLKEGDPSKAPHVISNSWGCPTDEGCQGDEFVPVLEALQKAGIMVVASAGNDGPGCSTIKDPSATHSDLTFSVGAVDHRNGEIAYFSSRGPSTRDGGLGPDVTAPGVSVRSTIPGNSFDGTFWSGTSMAGPHVAGAVALLWSARPHLAGRVQETAEVLRKTAAPKASGESCGGIDGSQVPNNTYGHGSLDVYEAVRQAR